MGSDLLNACEGNKVEEIMRLLVTASSVDVNYRDERVSHKPLKLTISHINY